ncbi:hypothetical protein FACS189494_06950 [Spirochaetia bacterium]|nr:hypothetical protein FACS189494_06950 [Spirochaetia bacterium]
MHDGSGHVHEHNHDGLHHHEHTEGCGNTGEHAHGHHHGFVGQADVNQIKHILGYMLDHNREHANELTGMSAKLRGAGQTEAADALDESIKLMGSGNDQLALTLTKIK